MSNTRPVEEETMTMAQLDERIKDIAKNLKMEDMGDKIREEMKKGFAEWEKKSAKQRRVEEREALFGNHAEKSTTDKGNKIAKMLPALAHQLKYGNEAGRAYAEKHGLGEVTKALEASTFEAGGALIPEDYSNDFIELLRNRTVVRRMGAVVVDMPNGNLNLGKQNSAATAYWVGEGNAITESEQTFGQLNLSAKKLGILVPISNDLIKQAPAGFEAIVRNDMEAAAAIAEDQKFIRGDGTSDTPKGIKNWLAAGQSFAANTTVNLANVTADLLKAMYKVTDANVPGLRNGWMMNPRTVFYLMSLRTDDGYPVFLEELRNGMLYGAPVGQTKNIPRNLDYTTSGANDETEIYFGDFSQVIIGQTRSTEIKMFDGAAWSAASGARYGAQEDMQLLRLTMTCDLVVRHNTAFSVIEGVDYGKSFDA